MALTDVWIDCYCEKMISYKLRGSNLNSSVHMYTYCFMIAFFRTWFFTSDARKWFSSFICALLDINLLILLRKEWYVTNNVKCRWFGSYPNPWCLDESALSNAWIFLWFISSLVNRNVACLLSCFITCFKCKLFV